MGSGLQSRDIASFDCVEMLKTPRPAVYSLRGGVVIEGPVEGEKLRALQICRQLGIFRPPDIQLQALLRICELPLGRVYIARRHNTIIGYTTFHIPDDYCHWGCHESLVEIGAMEVSAEWRCCHIATDLLQYIFDHSMWEKYIVVSFNCSRHWDLKGANLSLWQYRDMLHRLMTRVGFAPAFTTMYDIVTDPVNMLMARRGEQISGGDWLLFQKIAASF